MNIVALEVHLIIEHVISVYGQPGQREEGRHSTLLTGPFGEKSLDEAIAAIPMRGRYSSRVQNLIRRYASSIH